MGSLMGEAARASRAGKRGGVARRRSRAAAVDVGNAAHKRIQASGGRHRSSLTKFAEQERCAEIASDG